MKPKPLSHKNLNTFHFATFSERLNDINVSVIRQNDISALPEGRNTYFWEAFEKWRDRDYTIDYENFRKELGDEIETLQQILFRKNEIVELLIKYLRKKESLAIPAIMELTVALARDLQDEMYPYFPQIFSAITSHFHSQDTDLLEKLFMGLAYLFKFFWKYMIKDIKNVYKLFSTLLEDSNREHIRVFACESFGFLIRKVRSREELFTYILKGLQKRPELTSGVGQLFFEVVKGVKEQFHSCVEPVLNTLLKLLGDENLSSDLNEEALLQTFDSMATHTVQKHCEVVQKTLCGVIEGLIKECQTTDSIDSKIKHLDHVLHLLLFWIRFKNGKLITSENNLIEVILQLTSLKDIPDYCMKSISEISSSVLISRCLKLSIDKVNLIIAKIYSCSEDILFHFTRNMLEYGMFEKDVLPVLVSVSLKILNSDDMSKKKGVMRMLSDTVTTLRPVIASEDDVKSFTKLYLYPSSTKGSNAKETHSVIPYSVMEDFFLETLSLSEIKQSDLPDIWMTLVCLPHIRSVNIDKASLVLENLSKQISETLLSSESLSVQEIEEFGFVLSQAYFTFLIISSNDKNGLFETSFFINLLKKLPSCISILRIVYCHLSSCATIPILEELHDIISLLLPNLSSPFNLIRLLSLKILKTFDSQMNVSKNEASVFSICLEAEKVPIDVQNYREKLKFLRKLEYEFIHKDLPATFETLLLKACMHYFIGMLYINFKLLWTPTHAFIKTFAHGTPKLFWEIFGTHLVKTVELCAKFSSTGKCFDISKWEVEDDQSPFLRAVKSCCEPTENPDIMNHRLLLWKSMELFPDIAEARNRVVVPLIFQLMTDEVVKVDTSLASSETVNKKDATSDSVLENSYEEVSSKGLKRKLKSIQPGSKKLKLEDSMDETSSLNLDITEPSLQDEIEPNEVESETEDLNEDDSDVEVEDNDQEEELESKETNLGDPKIVLPRKKVSNNRRFHLTKTLAAYLSVFAKFRRPKSGYKYVELEQLYNELLTYPDSTIQKLAFDCLLTFNLKYLNPYTDNFYRILDNKTFKTEVVLFNLDKENKVLGEEHRMDALAVLMRILYGKMLHKTGSNTSGKSLANARRSLVLRFLAGCQGDELKVFFELVFLPFKELLIDDTLTAVKNIRENLDLSNIVPIRRQHSALNTLDMILKHLGNLVPEMLPYLLKVLLVITATSTTLLEKRSEVLPQCLNTLKSVRTLAVIRIIQFFKSFPEYQFTPEELDALFESIVWPMLPRLEMESVNQPSPLLRLFATWSENSRYFILFAKHHEESKTLTPLKHIMDLYCSQKAKGCVINVVSQILYLFLTADKKVVHEEDEEIQNKVPPIEINFCLSLPDVTIDGVESSLGNKLIQPHIKQILSRFERTARVLGSRKSKKTLPIRDLTIMLRLSRFVQDPEESSKLIRLLPPFLSKPKIGNESEVLILRTISNLIRNCASPDNFIRQFSPLFGKISSKSSRTALVAVFTSVAEAKPEFQTLASIVSKVNAFDTSLVDEPDYQLRLEGHKEALKYIKSMELNPVNIEFIRLIIFNSSFMIRNIDDMALRNNSSYLLQELTQVMYDVINSNSDLTRNLLYDTLLTEIQKGLKSNSEAVRHEFIQILSAVLNSWKDEPSFKELVALCHEDKELDFWENIRHLQVHRRARALLRFCESLKAQCEAKEEIPVHYLTSYILPIVMSFLFDLSYKKHVHVIDAAIETLGCVARALPWHHYESLLKQYLQMLTSNSEHHKTVIKVIVSLLNAFHFEVYSKKDDNAAIEEAEKKDVDKEEDKMKIDDESENKITNISIVEEKPSKTVAFAESDKIYFAIRKNILPLLHRSLMKKTKRDDEHKLSGKYFPEDEEILRVPIALAMVKLLQNLPIEILEKSVPGLFLRMCDLLKTKTESIRHTARETLVKMLDSLGPKYFPSLVYEMKGVMKRGYQVHVLTYTINAVLLNLSSQMKPGDLDRCAKDLIEICTNELFSDVAEEKEVEKITVKVKEAKSVKSYSIFQQLSRFVSGNYLLEMIKPLKEALGERHSHKTLKKVSDSLRHIALGLSENKGLTNEKQLRFIYGIINESMPGINKRRETQQVKSKKIERPDSFLIPKDPGRSGPPAKINVRTTDHVFVEFGLQILQFSLKRDQIDKNRKEILEMLDPFVAILSDCLQSNNIKIITEALRCLLPLYKYSLPAFKTATKNIVGSLFLLVNKYAAVGMGQGENFEMIVVCFKMFTVLVKYTSYHAWTDEQLQSLLSYIAQDVCDYTRQATAFTLLKAILSKKIQTPELRNVMSKIAEMAINSEQDFIRSQSRQVCMQYMLDYPLGKQLAKTISFFAVQLEYFHEYGRVSALEIISSMLLHFPVNVLKKHSSVFLVPLAARLVNDDSSNCRKMSAVCIKKLLTKVGHDGRQSLFSIPLNWLKAKQNSHKRLGAQLCGLFAEVAGDEFEHNLQEILSLFVELISGLKKVEIKSSTDERCADHFLYHILNALTKILTYCAAIRKEEFSDSFNALWGELQDLILYPHLWVRLATGELFGLLLSAYKPEEIVAAVSGKEMTSSIFVNSRQRLRDLSADFATQLQSPYLNEQLGEQIIRNLVYLSRVISKLSKPSESDTTEVSVEWILRKLCREAKMEVAEQPEIIQRRKCVFMFMGAFANEMGREKVLPLLEIILVPLSREISDNSKYPNEELRKCTQEVLDLIQNIVGAEEYTTILSSVQMSLQKKKNKRKLDKAAEAVTDPQKYAVKRIKKQLNKKDSKKRKIMKLKGKKKVVKKKKLSDLVIAS